MKRRITVNCIMCGQQEITDNEYMRQLSAADSLWTCPHCLKDAHWGGIEYACKNCGKFVSEEIEWECPHCEMCYVCGDTDLMIDGNCPACPPAVYR